MAIATIIGSEIGSRKAKGDKARQENQLKGILDYFQSLEAPTAEEQKLKFDKYKYTGDYRPDVEQFFSQGGTEYDKMSLDPATRNAQMQALARLQGISEQGGMDAIDRARMSEITGQADRAASARRAALQQQMQMRGMGGSGFELAQALAANQEAAGQGSRQSMQAAADAQQRALQAIMASGELGGNIRGQDFGQASERARAQDAINRFNAMQRQDLEGRTLGARNAAQLRNLDARQRLGSANVDLSNQQQTMNKDAYQREFQNQMQRGAAQAAARQGLSSMYGQRAGDTQRKYTGYGRAIDETAESIASMYTGGMYKGTSGSGAQMAGGSTPQSGAKAANYSRGMPGEEDDRSYYA